MLVVQSATEHRNRALHPSMASKIPTNVLEKRPPKDYRGVLPTWTAEDAASLERLELRRVAVRGGATVSAVADPASDGLDSS